MYCKSIDSNLISFVSCDGVHIGEIREVYGDFSIHVRKTKAESLCNAMQNDWTLIILIQILTNSIFAGH